MGDGYWVLVWDGWGAGLNMINPRVLHDADGNNWWPSPTDLSDDDLNDFPGIACGIIDCVRRG